MDLFYLLFLFGVLGYLLYPELTKFYSKIINMNTWNMMDILNDLFQKLKKSLMNIVNNYNEISKNLSFFDNRKTKFDNRDIFKNKNSTNMNSFFQTYLKFINLQVLVFRFFIFFTTVGITLSLQGDIDEDKGNYLFYIALSNLFLSLGLFSLFLFLFLQIMFKPQVTLNQSLILPFIIFSLLSFVGYIFYRIYTKHEYMRLKQYSQRYLDKNYHIIFNLLFLLICTMSFVKWYIYSERKDFVYNISSVLFFLVCFWAIQIISNRYSYERLDFFQTYLSLVFISFVIINFLFYRLFKNLSDLNLCLIRDKTETSSIVFLLYKILCMVPLYFLGINSVKDIHSVFFNL